MNRILLLLFFIGLCTCNPKEKNSYILPELQDVVIYQINPRVFAPDNSFQAIIPHLDSIKELGCNILWFMPIYEIGKEKTKNSPYSIKDYRSVNPEFGTLNDFKKLVNEAHKRNLGVILDWVPNHTSWDHYWITEHKDWYTQDSLGNIIHPEGTDWTDVADLNYDNPDLRLKMIEEMKYWIKSVGIDGFRCDAVDYLPFDFLKQCNDSIRAIPGKKLLLLAEGNREDHFKAGFDLNYAWDFAVQMRKVYQDNISASTLFEENKKEYETIPPGKYKLRFTTNHDEAAKHSPIDEWINIRGSMSAFSVILFMPGIPMVYGSQEVGYPSSINFFHYNNVNWSANPDLWKEYQTLLRIHNQFQVLRNGQLTEYPDDDILMFERYDDHERILIAINTRNNIQQVELPESIANKQYINLASNRNISIGDVLNLQAFEYIILK